MAADGQDAEVDIDAIGIDLSAGVADGGDEASPVGIGAGPGGFDQRRVGDGLGDAERVGVGCRAFDVQFDNMGDALAVGDDLAREGGADLGEGVGKSGVAGPEDGGAGA